MAFTTMAEPDVHDLHQAMSDEAPERASQPLAMVIFGGTGDLAHRKLIPALFHLWCSKLLPDHFAILGFGRSHLDSDQYRDTLRQSLAESKGFSQKDWEGFSRCISYVQGQYDNEDSFRHLRDVLAETDQRDGTENHYLFYLSTPPNVYGPVTGMLGKVGLNHPTQPDGWVRLVVEKPFGRDLATARALDRCIHEYFDESQVYRIDHYLGKETVQNIFVLRFINGIFEPLWNRNYVDYVEITAAESIGIEGRGGYYEEAGALRDMLQSHLIQLLTLTAMEPPSQFTGDKVRDEKVKVLDALHFPGSPENCVVRGQYARGKQDGHDVPGYREEEGVAPKSRTETFIAAKLMVDNWRWKGVPFYLRTGKRLPHRVSEIAVHFRKAPVMLLPEGTKQHPRDNVLVLRLQPNDGLSLRLEVKVPGPAMKVRPVEMNFLYSEAFGGNSPDAYERLLLDAMRGDSTLFARTDEVESAWTLITPLLESWDSGLEGEVHPYAAGTWGPPAADVLLAASGHHWRTP